jgi:molecular chaperone DnaJ
VPSQLNAAQRAKLQEFAALCAPDTHPISQSFLDKARNLFR